MDEVYHLFKLLSNFLYRQDKQIKTLGDNNNYKKTKEKQLTFLFL